MDQQRNLIIAIALSVAILIGFQFFFELPQQRQKAQQAPQTTSQPATTPSAKPSQVSPATPATTAPAAEKPREEVLAGTPRVSIDTPRLKGSINLTGDRIDDLTLVNYRETIDPDSPNIVLLSPDRSEERR